MPDPIQPDANPVAAARAGLAQAQAALGGAAQARLPEAMPGAGGAVPAADAERSRLPETQTIGEILAGMQANASRTFAVMHETMDRAFGPAVPVPEADANAERRARALARFDEIVDAQQRMRREERRERRRERLPETMQGGTVPAAEAAADPAEEAALEQRRQQAEPESEAEAIRQGYHAWQAWRDREKERQNELRRTQPARLPETMGQAVVKALYVSRAGQQERLDKTLTNIFGQGFDPQAIQNLIGAPDDAKIGYRRVDDDTIKVKWTHPKLEQPSVRTIGVDKEGKRYIHNDLLVVKKSDRGGGFGTEVFSKEAKAAQEMGFARIETHAAGHGPQAHPHPSYFSGYRAWPPMGYDQPIGKLPKYAANKIQEHFPHAQTIQDVIRTPEGLEWWNQHGTDLQHAEFDLAPGSESMRILDANLASRASGIKPPKALPVSLTEAIANIVKPHFQKQWEADVDAGKATFPAENEAKRFSRRVVEEGTDRFHVGQPHSAIASPEMKKQIDETIAYYTGKPKPVPEPAPPVPAYAPAPVPEGGYEDDVVLEPEPAPEPASPAPAPTEAEPRLHMSGGGIVPAPGQEPETEPAQERASPRLPETMGEAVGATRRHQKERQNYAVAKSSVDADNRIHQKEVASMERPAGGIWDDEQLKSLENEVEQILGGEKDHPVAKTYWKKEGSLPETHFFRGGKYRGMAYREAGKYYVSKGDTFVAAGKSPRLAISPDDAPEIRAEKIKKSLGIKATDAAASPHEERAKLPETMADAAQRPHMSTGGTVPDLPGADPGPAAGDVDLRQGGTVPDLPGADPGKDSVPAVVKAGEEVIPKAEAQSGVRSQESGVRGRLPSSLGGAIQSLVGKASGVKTWMEKRYGKAGAGTAFAFGQASTWGASAALTAATGVPLMLPPGTGALAALAFAETRYRLQSPESRRLADEEAEAEQARQQEGTELLGRLPQYPAPARLPEGADVEALLQPGEVVVPAEDRVKLKEGTGGGTVGDAVAGGTGQEDQDLLAARRIRHRELLRQREETLGAETPLAPLGKTAQPDELGLSRKNRDAARRLREKENRDRRAYAFAQTGILPGTSPIPAKAPARLPETEPAPLPEPESPAGGMSDEEKFRRKMAGEAAPDRAEKLAAARAVYDEADAAKARNRLASAQSILIQPGSLIEPGSPADRKQQAEAAAQREGEEERQRARLPETVHEASWLQQLYGQRQELPSLAHAILAMLSGRRNTEEAASAKDRRAGGGSGADVQYGYEKSFGKDLVRATLPMLAETLGWNQQFAVAEHAPPQLPEDTAEAVGESPAAPTNPQMPQRMPGGSSAGRMPETAPPQNQSRLPSPAAGQSGSRLPLPGGAIIRTGAERFQFPSSSESRDDLGDKIDQLTKAVEALTKVMEKHQRPTEGQPPSPEKPATAKRTGKKPGLDPALVRQAAAIAARFAGS